MFIASIRPALSTSAFLLAASLLTGCGGADETESGVTEIPAEEVAPPGSVPDAQATTVEGCLRAGDQPGTFVLAAVPSEMGAAADRALRGATATYTYLLVGEGLAAHVGRQVSVTGTMDDAANIEVDESSESTGQTTTVGDDEVTPTVEVEEEALIDVRRMRVSTVEPTGEACAAS